MAPLTRREALIGGAGVAAGFGLWGRYALGGTFEDHVADQLGITGELARELIEAMRSNLGWADYEARAAAFTVATTLPGRVVIPRPLREPAVDAFIGALFGSAFGPSGQGESPAVDQLGGDNLGAVYAGLRPSIEIQPCGGLVDV